MDVEYRPYRGGFDIVSEYLETTSWLEPVRHETWQTPETFSRVLNRLTRDGFILPRGRRAITLTDLPRLERIAA